MDRTPVRSSVGPSVGQSPALLNPLDYTPGVHPNIKDKAGMEELGRQRVEWDDFLTTKCNPDLNSEPCLWQYWRDENRPSQSTKKLFTLFSPKLRKQKTLKRLIRSGIPPEHRGRVWWACSGAQQKMDAASPEDQYHSLVERSESLLGSFIATDIDKDISRTYTEKIVGIEYRRASVISSKSSNINISRESKGNTNDKDAEQEMSSLGHSSHLKIEKDCAIGDEEFDFDAEDEADEDLHRPSPSDPLSKFSLADVQGEMESLRRVLFAYALRNPAIGYCQSMNFLCALLLFHLSEEEAFWVFASLLEDLLPRDYYSPTMLGAKADQQVLQACIGWKLPRVYAHLKSINAMLEPVSYPWFLCLFVNILSVYTVCRVWDCLFYEGNVVLFRVALAMIRSKTDQLTAAIEPTAVYMILKDDMGAHSFPLSPSDAGSTPSTKDGSFSTEKRSEHSWLMEEAFYSKRLKSIPRKKIKQLREFFTKIIADEEAKREEEDYNDELDGNCSVGRDADKDCDNTLIGNMARVVASKLAREHSDESSGAGSPREERFLSSSLSRKMNDLLSSLQLEEAQAHNSLFASTPPGASSLPTPQKYSPLLQSSKHVEPSKGLAQLGGSGPASGGGRRASYRDLMRVAMENDAVQNLKAMADVIAEPLSVKNKVENMAKILTEEHE